MAKSKPAEIGVTGSSSATPRVRKSARSASKTARADPTSPSTLGVIKTSRKRKISSLAKALSGDLDRERRGEIQRELRILQDEAARAAQDKAERILIKKHGWAPRSHYANYTEQAKQTIRPFDFLSLPGEIRNAIYGLLVIKSDARLEWNYENLYQDLNGELHFGVLRTCKQIYEEALSIFYKKNSFKYFAHMDSEPSSRLSFSPTLKFDCIERVTLDIGFDHALAWNEEMDLSVLGCMTNLANLTVTFVACGHISHKIHARSPMLRILVINALEVTPRSTKIVWNDPDEAKHFGGCVIDPKVVEDVAQKYKHLQGTACSG